VVAMLRGLNDNNMRLAVLEWLKNSMIEQPKTTEPDAVDARSVASGDVVEETHIDIPLLERKESENGSLVSMTLNFPEIAKSVKAPGDAI